MLFIAYGAFRTGMEDSTFVIYYFCYTKC